MRIGVLKQLGASGREHGQALVREHGQALVMMVAGLAGFMGLVGLSIDIGQVVYTRTELQKAADAGALGGAQELPADMDEAESAAFEMAELNADAEYGVSFPSSTHIRVSAGRKVEFTFLKLVGVESWDVSASATALAEANIITGYHVQQTAPFIIWGGSRDEEVHPGDQNCPLHTCVGKSYTFLDTSWMTASGEPTGPDWTASDSNNFKGDINHGAGNPLVQVGDELTVDSMGGLGSVEAPAVGSIIVIPVVSKAKGNSDNRTYTIGAWVMVEVKAGCKKSHCEGKILPGTVPAPDGWGVGGEEAPPSNLEYIARIWRLVE